MDIWQIESVLAVAKCLNFTRAAENLCISQSALSLQIIKLEEELGVKLFERTTRTLHLTPAGQEFVVTANQIPSLFRQIKHNMDQFATLQRGRIVVGTLPIMGYLGIPSLIAEFKRNYPGIIIETHEAASDVLIQMLENCEIDVALFTPPHNSNTKGNDIIIEPLFSDEIVLVIEANHPFAQRDFINLSETATENHIFMKSNYGFRETLINACKDAGFEPNIVYQCEQVESIMGFVSAGLGVAFLNVRIPQHSNEQNINYVHIHPAMKRDTVLAIRDHSKTSPAIEAFKSYAIKWAKERK